ncbi:hypothetical protein IU440_10235 [Nocardia cyriacigeorgica]|uniref:hypothetical protein n=1 Tax=Nocardia cyriacigeorgica TaxID=135487 RepID=UPI001895D76B|nr:hypothetical protein [Nocardia cyriacigeorgica]MBF6425059.1 hypothetical protein [Nocardia cyriacigeorgica]
MAQLAVIFASACSTVNAPSAIPEISSTAPASTTADKKVRDLCEPLLNFFENELNAANIRVDSVRDLNDTYGRSGTCQVVNNSPSDGVIQAVGFAFIREDAKESDPTGGRPGFEPVAGHEAPVWLLDSRTNRPGSGYVELATRIGNWNGTLQINDGLVSTTDGPLRMTDFQVDNAMGLIVRLTDDLRVE